MANQKPKILPPDFNAGSIEEPRCRMAISMMLTTAMSPRQIVSLTIDDVLDPDAPVMEVRENVSVPYTHGKNKEDRHDLYLPKSLREELKSYIFKHRKALTGWLFIGNRDSHLSIVHLWRLWKAEQVRMGWKRPHYTLYDCRTTAIKRFYEFTCNNPDASKVFGQFNRKAAFQKRLKNIEEASK